MTQRIFDIENEKDMQDLWEILPEKVVRIEKAKTPERMDEVFECDYEIADEIAKELNLEEFKDVAED